MIPSCKIYAQSNAWKKIPSDKAAVIVGLGKPKVVTGGGTMVIPIIQRMDVITLENIMFPVEIRQTKTALGVPLNAEGIVVIKVKNDQNSILAAVQQFNSAKEEQTLTTIRTQASEICKGKLREIVSSMSVEDIYNDRESFSAKVQQVAGTELGEMGLELKSFTINDMVLIITEEKNIELAKKRAERKEAELSETVVKPAEAARQKQQLEAEGKKFEQVKAAEAEAEKLRLEGEAQAILLNL